jgi:hypothetical protein
VGVTQNPIYNFTAPSDLLVNVTVAAINTHRIKNKWLWVTTIFFAGTEIKRRLSMQLLK